MDTSYEKGFLGKSDMEVIKIDEQLHFETVLIPVGEFEVIYPQSSSSNEIKMFESSDMYTFPDNEINGSHIGDSNEKFITPSHDLLTNEIREESNIMENIEAHGSTAKLNELNENQGCVWVHENLFRAVPQSNYIFVNKAKQDSSKISSLTSSFNKRTSRLINSGSSSQISKDPISKRKMNVLELQQKEEYLKETLNGINEVICGMKEVASYTVPSSNFKLKKRLIGNSSVSKNSEGTQNKIQSSEVAKSPKRGQNLNKTPIHSSDKSEECDIDFLKGCIIEASRTLIKTEKSLKVLSRLLQSNVLTEKQTAVKYLKNFQYTFNTFRKTVNGIDKSLLTHYRHLIPNMNTEPMRESVSKDNLDPHKSKNNVIDYENLLNGDKHVESIIPAVSNKQVKEISGNSTGGQIEISNLGACYPTLAGFQSELKKRKGNNDCPSTKKIKTRTMHHSWSSRLENSFFGKQ